MAGIKRNSAAKRFQNPPFDRANIYVYRLTGRWDADLFLDGVRVTMLPLWSFIVLPVRPGSHTLAVRHQTRAAVVPKEHNDAELEMYAGVGSNYFIEQTGHAVGLVYREIDLERIDPEDAKERIQRCTLVRDRPPPLPPFTP